MTLPLSKTLDPVDFIELAPELAVVDQHFTSAREQHPMRRWEYAMALRAAATVDFPRTKQIKFVDVGGAGSPFVHMLQQQGWIGTIVDPDAPIHTYQQFAAWRGDLADYLVHRPCLTDAVFCLSVLEHVEDLDQFLYHLSCLVAPGGLLFLTMDVQEHMGPDDKHFHWMRKRIFSPWEIQENYIYEDKEDRPFRDFSPLGIVDPRWHGPQVYDYSFASLALVKRS